MATEAQKNRERIERARDLELRFAKSLAKFREVRRLDPRVRPFYVEMFGLPKSFKTTTCTTMETFIKRVGWLIFAPPEGPEVIPVTSKRTPSFNDKTFRYALGLMEEHREGPLEIVILERAIFDHVTWLEYWERKGKLTPEDRARSEAYALQPRLRADFDAHLCFVCEPEIGMQREVANLLSSHAGETMNPATMTMLREIHQQVYARYGEEDGKMLFLDTSHMEVKDVALACLEHVCAAVERRLKAIG
jgi:hypothetical protein